MTREQNGGLAASLLKGPKSSDDSEGSDYGDEATGDDAGREDAAKRLISALGSKDAAGVVAAFGELMELCAE